MAQVKQACCAFVCLLLLIHVGVPRVQLVNSLSYVVVLGR